MTTRSSDGPGIRRAARTALAVGAEYAWLVIGLLWLVAALATDQLMEAMAARRS